MNGSGVEVQMMGIGLLPVRVVFGLVMAAHRRPMVAGGHVDRVGDRPRRRFGKRRDSPAFAERRCRLTPLLAWATRCEVNLYVAAPCP